MAFRRYTESKVRKPASSNSVRNWMKYGELRIYKIDLSRMLSAAYCEKGQGSTLPLALMWINPFQADLQTVRLYSSSGKLKRVN